MPGTGVILKQPASPETVFRAVSDRTRLRVLNLLTAGEICVCDLMRVLAISQAKVSRHLAYLRRAGLVRARKEGLWHYYRLGESKSAFHSALMACLSACHAEVPELKTDLAELRRTGCRGGCC